MVYLNQNRPQDAKDMFTQLLTQDPDSAEGHYGLGLALAAEDNHQAAIEEYKTATRLDPQAAGIDYDLGVPTPSSKCMTTPSRPFSKSGKTATTRS